MTTVSASTLAYLGNAYGGTSTATATSSSTASSKKTSATATQVTISDTARALLAGQYSDQDFAAVTTQARTALDNLYKAANVSKPFADDEPTIDISSLDRRAVYAIASNSQGLFTADEQKLAAQQLQQRFDAAMKPALEAAKLLNDYSSLYKTALAYFDGMSPEEKADPAWVQQRAALSQGYQQALQNPAALPQNIPNDPLADFITRDAEAPASDPAKAFDTAASKARAALDQQYLAAKNNGKNLVFDASRRNGQLADFSGFDNQSLSAISLNEGNQFSQAESYAAKQVLSERTRTNILKAFQQGTSSGDPRAASLGLIQQYQAMTPQERQAAGISSGLLDIAVSNYKSTTQLMSMFSQATASSGSANGSASILDYM
jgi:hypothetical protein